MRTNRTDDARGRRRPPTRGRPGGACPFTLWRTREPARIADRDVAAIARSVAATAILHERRWPAARAGDPAASAAVAIDRLHRQGPVGPMADLVMSHLVVLARRDGDPTARVVLAHALRSLARRRPGNADIGRIADGWSVRPTARRVRGRARR